MALLNILTYPDKFLTQPAKPVDIFDDDLQKLIEDMAETMYAAPGIGLAAVQVGVDKRLIVYDTSSREDGPHLEVLINPVILEKEGETVSKDEGCLSVPDFRADVKRAARVKVQGSDREGRAVDIDADGMLALVLQHEIDHLDGILFIERISALKRELYKRRVKKMSKKQ